MIRISECPMGDCGLGFAPSPVAGLRAVSDPRGRVLSALPNLEPTEGTRVSALGAKQLAEKARWVAKRERAKAQRELAAARSTANVARGAISAGRNAGKPIVAHLLHARKAAEHAVKGMKAEQMTDLLAKAAFERIKAWEGEVEACRKAKQGNLPAAEEVIKRAKLAEERADKAQAAAKKLSEAVMKVQLPSQLTERNILATAAKYNVRVSARLPSNVTPLKGVGQDDGFSPWTRALAAYGGGYMGRLFAAAELGSARAFGQALGAEEEAGFKWLTDFIDGAGKKIADVVGSATTAPIVVDGKEAGFEEQALPRVWCLATVKEGSPTGTFSACLVEAIKAQRQGIKTLTDFESWFKPKTVQPTQARQDVIDQSQRDTASGAPVQTTINAAKAAALRASAAAGRGDLATAQRELATARTLRDQIADRTWADFAGLGVIRKSGSSTTTTTGRQKTGVARRVEAIKDINSSITAAEAAYAAAENKQQPTPPASTGMPTWLIAVLAVLGVGGAAYAFSR